MSTNQSINRRQILGMSGLAITGLALASCTGETASTEKHFTGINVTYFVGGEEGSPFSDILYSGARAAERDLGCTVAFVESGWDTEKMTLQLKESIDKKSDAICLMGHPGDDSLGPLIDEARRKGIIITVQNVDLPLARTQYSGDGFGYVGQMLYESGALLGQGLIRKFGLEPGELVLHDVGGETPRRQGVFDVLEEAGLIVQAKELDENDPNADEIFLLTEQRISGYLAEYPKARAIIAGNGVLTQKLAKALPQIIDRPGDIIGAGFDLSPGSLEGIRSGYLGLVHDQQPYLQGYLPILQACLSRKYGFGGLVINTGSGLVDTSNVEAIADLVEQKIR